ALGSGGGATGLGTPNAVNTGMEVRIPIAAIGYSGTGPIKISAFVSDGGVGSCSNQWLGGLPPNTGNLGSPAGVDLTAAPAFNNNQFVTITPSVLASAPVIDGLRDAGYGGTIASPDPRLQTCYTGYGKSNHNQIVRGGPGTQDGSELDNIYVGINGGFLYIHFGGNLEANGNRLNIFIDSDNNAATGQNQITGGALRAAAAVPAEGAFPLNNMGAGGNGPGLKFDAGFGPDYFISINGSDLDASVEVENNVIFTDFSSLPTSGGGNFFFVGNTGYGVAGGTAPTGGDPGSPDIRVSVNNSNTAGVAGELVGSSAAAPNVDFAFGSEIDAVYGRIEGGRLYLLVTGNIERNFNALCLFFDVAPGG
ncbi:MAG: hypothetical protein K2V38_08315, partial [Gemmataceae bacterium]|nr:hypothetical protein [Gemmataceae bacterium]